MRIEFRGSYTEGDLLRLSRAAFSKSLKTSYWIIVALVALATLWEMATGRSPQLLAPSGLLVLLGFVYFVVVRAVPRNQFASSELLSQERRGHADEQVLAIQDTYFRATIPWEKLNRCVVRADVVYILESSVGAHVFPRRFFASDEDWRRFRELVAAKLRVGRIVETSNGLRRLVWGGALLMLAILLWNLFAE